MGQCAEAILFWGYVWDEEGEPWNISPTDPDAEECYGVWEKRLRKRTGFSQANPWKEAPSGDAAAKAWAKHNRKHIDAYYEAERAHVKTHARGCKVGDHCCDAAEMPYVAIEASETCIEWGEAIALDAARLVVKPEWEADIKAFCEVMGIDVGSRRLGWWVVARMGC